MAGSTISYLENFSLLYAYIFLCRLLNLKNIPVVSETPDISSEIRL